MGSAAIMAEQLRHVLDVASYPNVTVQVLPFSAGITPAMGVAFLVAEFRDGPDVLHLDGAPDPSNEADGDTVARYKLVFDHLRAQALPEGPSAATVAARIEELGK